MSGRRITGLDPTGSTLDRISHCTASAALPQVFDGNEREDRDRGTSMHSFLHRVAELKKAGDADPRATALAEVDDQHRANCADLELAKLAPQLDMSTEVALAYNFLRDTARVLTPVAPRMYEVDTDEEVALTIDVGGVAVDPNSKRASVYVGDYKGPYGWLPEPQTSLQLGTGALALARLHKARSAEVEYIRLRSDGTPKKFSATLDVFGLENAADRVADTMSSVKETRDAVARGAVPNVTEGPWCRYCPARQHCPAKTALIRSVLHDPPAISMREAITSENAASVYAMVRKAKDAIAAAEGALYAYAKVEPIMLGTDDDGALRFFGELRRPGNEVLDGAITHRVLAAKFGGEAANHAVTMEVTKKAITDVARAQLKPGEKITKVVDSIVDEVRKLGGAKRPETCTTTEYTLDAEGETKARKRKAS